DIGGTPSLFAAHPPPASLRRGVSIVRNPPSGVPLGTLIMNAVAFALSFLPLMDVAAEQARRPIAPRFGAVLRKHNPQYVQQASPPVSAAVFLRRVSLDLTGVI